MSQTIDSRVVEMTFDNKQFETGAATTMSTLQKLKKSLDFSKITTSFSHINKAANKVDMSGLDKTISGIKNKFSTLEIMAITTVSNITNSLLNSAKRWTSAFTIDPIRTGFREYETQINAVQTILANTQKEGTNIKDVNAALDELNTYADKTIYNFTEMTRNIGTFTAAGVDLKTSVSAIQGIANLAAVSGSNSQQASTAMYQLSQALATGTIRLMDWNSVVNAGMGGQIFQDALIETSRLLGTGADAAIEASGTFRQSLQAGWLTSEVLTKTLKKFTTSGAAEYVANYTGLSKQAIEAELELAKSTYGEADAIDKASESLAKKSGKNKDEIAATLRFAQTAEDAATKVKTFTQLIDNLKEVLQSGWAQSFRIIIGDFEEAKELFTEISDSFGAVISASADARNKLLAEVFDDSGREMLIDSLRNSIKGLLSVIKPIREAFREIFPPATAKQVRGLLESFHEFTKTLTISKNNSQNLRNVFKGLFDIVKLLGDGVGALGKLIIPVVKPISSISSGLFDIAGFSGEALSSFSNWVRQSPNISNAYNIIGESFKSAMTTFGSFVEKAKDFKIVQNVIEVLKKRFEQFGIIVGKIEIRLIPFTSVLELMLSVIQKIGPVAVAILNKIGNAFSSILNAISKTLSSGGFNAIYDLFNIAVLTGIGVQLTKFIKNINETVTYAGGFINKIKGILSDITDAFDDLQKNLQANTLKQIGIALALVAGSIFVISMIDSEKLSGSLAAITLLIGELVGVFILLNKIEANKNGSIKALGSLVSMSLSILILASALKKISDIGSEKLLGSLAGITTLLVEMTGIAIILSKYGGKVKTGVIGIMAFSSAIYILSSAIKKVGELDVDVLTKGLISVGVLLGELAAFMVGAKFGKLKISQAVAIVILSESLIILQKAVEKFGSMDTGILLTGIIAVGAVLTEIAAFSTLTSDSKHIFSTSVSLVIMAKALEMLEKPMFAFGNMKTSQIAKGLIAIGVVLSEIVIAMRLFPKNALTMSVSLIATAEALISISNVVLNMSGMPLAEVAKGLIALGGSMAILAISMNAMKGTLGGSVAMLVMSASLAIFVPVLKTLSSFSFVDIVKGLIALAGAFAVIGVASSVLSPAIPAMLGITGAMVLLGVASAAVGAGVAAISIGLTALGTSAVVGAAALVQAAKILVVGFLNAISDSASAIGRTVKTLILTACEVLVKCIPTIANTVFAIVKEVLTGLADNTPEIVSELLKLIIGVIDALAADLPMVIQSVENLLSQLFTGIIQALKNIDINTIVNVIVSIGIILTLMYALSAMVGLIPSAMLGVLGLEAVIAELALVLAGIGTLTQIPGLSWLIGKGRALLQQIGTSIGNFIGGIVGGVMEGISTQLPQIGTNLSEFMTNLQPFIAGSKNLDVEALGCVGLLTGIIVTLTAAEVINGIISLTGLSLVDMAVELSEFMVALQPFIMGSRLLTIESMQACFYLARMIVVLTAAEIISGIGKILGLGGGSLAYFGKELSVFGPYIKQFAEDVKYIKPEAVQGAASAAEIMAKLANKLPTQGGFIKKIFGDKSLANFGEELVKFGPLISKFADQVKNVDPKSVAGVQSVTTIMTDLADNLPDNNTLVEKIFGGGKVTFSEFGKELIGFGTSMSDFSDSVSDININKTNGAIASFKKLVDLSKSMNGASASKLVDFSNKLSEIGSSSVKNFISAFTNGGSKANVAVNSFINIVTSVLRSGGVNVKNVAIIVGNGLCIGIQNGIISKQSSVIATEKTLTMAMINKMKQFLPSSIFKMIGQTIPVSISNGIDSTKEMAITASTTLAISIFEEIKNNLSYDKFYDIGTQIANGLSSGINDKIKDIAESAINAAKEIVDGVKDEFGMQRSSLSKLSSIASTSDDAANKAVKIVKNALIGISDAMENMDRTYTPRIVPVIDLGNVSGAANQIYSTFHGLDLSSTMGLAQSVSYDFTKKRSKSETENKANKKIERKLDQLIQDQNDSPRVENTNTFYIQSTDPKQAAEEVGYIMQHKVERRKATWGR